MSEMLKATWRQIPLQVGPCLDEEVLTNIIGEEWIIDLDKWFSNWDPETTGGGLQSELQDLQMLQRCLENL